MILPAHEDLPVNLLAACFNKTSATYKFYWFLSILNRVDHGEKKISKRHLFAEMISHSWFTVNYFHVSFGKQDKLQQAIEKLKIVEGLTIDAHRKDIFQSLITTENKVTMRELWRFNTEVPHRFLSPWFNAADLNSVYSNSQAFIGTCLYAVHKEHIEINPNWITYLKANSGILKAFCYWNLSIYLQSKNPNVPDIPNKLIKTPIRKSLNEQRKFWDIVIGELGSVDCIYTNTKLQIGAYAVEHFIPHAFVSHDLIWNLIPADRSFNSTKSDKLPRIEDYFEPFFNLQRDALEIVRYKAPKNKFLEDYITLFPLIDSEKLQRDKFLEQIQPLITIASNNGFEFLNSKMKTNI